MKTANRIDPLWLCCCILISGLLPSVLAVDSDHILRPGDSVIVTVFEQDEFTTEAQISRSGEIEVPLLGSVQLGGKSIKVAVAELTQKLSKGFVVDPKVTLTLTEGSTDQAFVIGMVKKPGPISFPGGLKPDVLSAIAIAGGFATDADRKNVSIRREVEGQTKLIRVAARMLNGEDADSVLLEPNDIVIVGQTFARQVTVTGEVTRPGFVEIPAEGDFNLLSAIAAAGSFSATADASRVTVRRGSSLHSVDVQALATVPGKNAFNLQADDIVIVGKLPSHTITIMGEVKVPGVIEIPADGSLTLLKAIALAGGYTADANPKKIVVRRRATEQGQEDKFYRVNGQRLAEDAAAQPLPLQPNDLITIPERIF